MTICVQFCFGRGVLLSQSTNPFHEALHFGYTLIYMDTLHIAEIPHIKDGAYYCYCAYVLRISRYSDFLSVMLTNTGIFLRGLKLSGESRS